MTPDYEPTIKRILDRTKYELYENMMEFLASISVTDADIWLRGFLTSPETLKAVFGEETVCDGCGVRNIKDCHCDYECAGTTENYIFQGEYLVPLDLPGVLNYYKEYFERR